MQHRCVSLICALGLAAVLAGCGRNVGPAKPGTVVVYVSEDQVFSEPLLKDFEKETGIAIKAVFDTEEAKSTGVMNRLMAEKNNPRADVYWANEPIRAELLKQQGISTPHVAPNAQGIPAQFKDPEGHWTGFSARSRPIVVNARLGQPRPQSIRDYRDPRLKGKGVIANPLFGTTTAYTAALFTLWGDDEAKKFLSAIKKNGVKLSTSNGESADLVASGEFGFSLVDSDDAFSRIKQGKRVEIVYPDQGPDDVGCMIIPNALVLIKGGSNPDNGKELINYLLSKESEKKLAFSDAAQIPLHAGVATPPQVRKIEDLKTMQVDYAQVARKMQQIQPFLKEWAGY
ncbi:MAG: extracellular solute-binding protein [Acidobacteria bacterium]|nr:extracellular solute-binding protein [Acidobacteriota bacterium]